MWSLFVKLWIAGLALFVHPLASSAPSISLSVPIVQYHHVARSTSKLDQMWFVTPEHFEKQLIYLRDNDFQTISMAQYDAALGNNSNVSLPDKSVILTFDDGYDDAYTQVYPLLKTYHMTGTFYVITGRVGTPGYLTWDQIEEMYKNGMEFGGHTVTHPFLTQLSIWGELWEIGDSRLVLEAHLNTTISTFAYPYNDHDRLTTLLPSLAGYANACIVSYHAGDSENDIYAIPRYPVLSGESLNVFTLVVNRHQPMILPHRTIRADLPITVTNSLPEPKSLHN